tara:strand:- start:18 stop:413 length:396 start_codon:yes stop_codon:yes gene_type:complete
MPKQLRLSGKFTGYEVDIIELVKKEYNLNDNQLVRQAVKDAINQLLLKEAFQSNPKLLKFFKSQYKYMEKFVERPSQKKRMEDELSKKFTQKDLDQFENVFAKADKVVKKLAKKKKPGRPKIKKKRGRPKR